MQAELLSFNWTLKEDINPVWVVVECWFHLVAEHHTAVTFYN